MPVHEQDGSLDPHHLDQLQEGHSLLDELVRRLEQAIQGDSFEGARAALDDFEEALDGHFEVEERVYFPLIERYAPEHRERVRRASEAHGAIRAQLENLQELMGLGERQAARVCLEALLGSFREHEAHESVLVETLEALADGQ